MSGQFPPIEPYDSGMLGGDGYQVNAGVAAADRWQINPMPTSILTPPPT
jgi:hypothetical protein